MILQYKNGREVKTGDVLIGWVGSVAATAIVIDLDDTMVSVFDFYNHTVHPIHYMELSECLHSHDVRNAVIPIAP